VPLYFENYKLLIKADHPRAKQGAVTWAEIGRIPLCLLTSDMQNRRIIDRVIAATGIEPAPMLESDSMTVLFAHVRTGLWASVVADRLVEALGLGEPLVSLDIVDAQQKQRIGLVLPQREPMTPLVHELYVEAKRIGNKLTDKIR
jgi:DNA-binding transcriptional LysR family regulator